MVSKSNNPVTQKRCGVFDTGVSLREGLDLQAAENTDEYTLLVPKLFRLEGIGFYSGNDMHALLCAEAALGT